MKTLALLLALSLLILPNPTHSIRNNPIRLPTAAHVALAASDTPVLDTDGMELQAGGVYSIHNAGTLRGVRLVGSGQDTECPSDVIFSMNTSADPIIFMPADPTATKVLESTLLNFKFNVSSSPQCENNGFWQVQYDVNLQQQIVKTGDVVRSLFKIERTSPPDVVPAYYGISYCPFDVCYGLIAYYDQPNDALHFALGNSSGLPVVFQKFTPPVLDTDGNELLARGVYNIISPDEPEGEVGLVKLDDTRECPSDVIIQNDNSGAGGEDRIMFTPPGFPNPLVRESTYLSIKFSPVDPTPLCQNNVSWEIEYDPKSGQEIVKTGDIVRQLFKIERLPSTLPLYKITYCPVTTLCYNVSHYKDTSNAIRLALSNDNFLPVVFKKATDITTL
nr:sporamin B-like [Ipomoea batatas]GME00728.1 sporamin B-like [Ipomoea batatas]GME08524.1 sporamin B-like [Ipomoea batatas]